MVGNLGVEPSMPKASDLQSGAVTSAARHPIFLLRLRDSTHRPYAGLLHRPHLFQRIVLPVVSGYLGNLLCIALTVS